MMVILLLFILSFLSAPSTSTRHICDEADQCKDKYLVCSSRESCSIECSANSACQGTTIECPIGQECHVKCYYDGEGGIEEFGQLICHQMVILGSDSTLLIINASFGNSGSFISTQTLESAQIYCPTNTDVGTTKPCQIYCDGDDLMRGTTINAKQGLNDLDIEAIQYNKNWCIRNTELNCGTDYSVSCPLINQPPFNCQESAEDKRCETMLIGPTPTPIISSETTTTTEPTVSSIATTGTGTGTTEIGDTVTTGAAKEVETTKGGISSDPNSGIVAGVLIPMFILSAVGFFCGWYIMKRRDTWFTEERGMRQRGQYKPIKSDDGGAHNRYNIDMDTFYDVGERPQFRKTKKSKLSNIRHHYKSNCSYCTTCINSFGVLCWCLIPCVIGVGGYYTVLEGIKKNDYANSFNIQGSCTISVTVKTCTRSYQQCTEGWNRKCETKTESYDCSYTLVNYRVNEDTNSTIFSCLINTTFQIERINTNYDIKQGQKSACWTNEHCHEIFDGTYNDHHSHAIGIYVGAALVFLCALCVCGGLCIGIKSEYTKGKNEYYKYQWNEVMSGDDRFDYVMTNWMRHYCHNGYISINDSGISYDVEAIIYEYLYYIIYEYN